MNNFLILIYLTRKVTCVESFKMCFTCSLLDSNFQIFLMIKIVHTICGHGEKQSSTFDYNVKVVQIFLILIILCVIFDFKTNFQFETLYEIYKENGIIDQQCAHEHHMSLHQNMASMIGFMIVLVGTRHW